MALLACAPAFFLTSQVLMPDMPMLCLFLLAVTASTLLPENRKKVALPRLLAFVAGFLLSTRKVQRCSSGPVLLYLGLCVPEWRTVSGRALRE